MTGDIAGDITGDVSTRPGAGAEAAAADGAGTQDDAGRELVARLAVLPAGERTGPLIDLVRAQAAAVLGHADTEEVGPDSAFFDIGFSSLTAVELRNRLAAATGLTLPAMLLFDHAVPREVAAYLLDRLEAEARV